MSREIPWDAPGWHALRRESSLAQQLIGSGATALGKASRADKMGEYYSAFFGLSVGVERLAKLILVADHALDANGQLPNQGAIRRWIESVGEAPMQLEERGPPRQTQRRNPSTPLLGTWGTRKIMTP